MPQLTESPPPAPILVETAAPVIIYHEPATAPPLPPVTLAPTPPATLSPEPDEFTIPVILYMDPGSGSGESPIEYHYELPEESDLSIDIAPEPEEVPVVLAPEIIENKAMPSAPSVIIINLR